MEHGSSAEERHWVLRQRPEVEGAVVALDPHTGRVLAMSGGFSYRQSKFNRATQAQTPAGLRLQAVRLPGGRWNPA